MAFQLKITLNPQEIASKFGLAIEEVKKITSEIRDEVSLIRERDPAAISDIEVLLLYPGLHALLCYRIAHLLQNKKKFLLARAVSQFGRAATGIEIHPGAEIGKGLFIDHGMGVVIGETTVIGDNCTIYQGATLGGTGKHTGKRHPTLGNNIMVGAGAKILGPIHIGDDAKIAAGAVVLKDVPRCSTAVGIPAKIVKRCDEPIKDTLDQVNVPDPITQELTVIKARLDELERKK